MKATADSSSLQRQFAHRNWIDKEFAKNRGRQTESVEVAPI
jgi:hypothetical protein